MANPELGTKQICPNCQSKFYDLGKRPAHCPKCGFDFDPEEAMKSRRVRARAAPADYEDAEEKPVRDEADEGFEEQDATPELDEAAEEGPLETEEEDDTTTPAPAGEPDLGVDFEEESDLAEEEDDDVPFLEESDEDLGEGDIEGLPEENGEDH